MRQSGWRPALSAALVLLCFLAVASQGRAAAVTGPANSPVQIAQSTAETATWQPTRAQIRAAQLRLKQLNFDPGAVDGNFGPRSAAALRAYQGSLGLEPDGRLTESLLARLMGQETPEEAQAADSAPPPGPIDSPDALEPAVTEPAHTPADCGTSVMGLWAFQDEQGSRFRLGLLDGGAVEGPFYSEHWSWQAVEGNGVQIRYDNGMGVSVVRSGTLQQDGRMSGDAQDSRGNRWAWQAARVLDPDAGADASCSPSG